MWRPDVLHDVTTNVRNHLPDRLTGVPANRTLGLLQAGDDGYSNMRGMGRTVSPGTVGHNGARGQIAWGDPATGLSFGYCTNGLDEHQVRGPAAPPRWPAWLPPARSRTEQRELQSRQSGTMAPLWSVIRPYSSGRR